MYIHTTFTCIEKSLLANATNCSESLPCIQISKDVIGFYDTVYDRGIQTTASEKKDAAAAVLKVFHESVSSSDLSHILCTTFRVILQIF